VGCVLCSWKPAASGSRGYPEGLRCRRDAMGCPPVPGCLFHSARIASVAGFGRCGLGCLGSSQTDVQGKQDRPRWSCPQLSSGGMEPVAKVNCAEQDRDAGGSVSSCPSRSPVTTARRQAVPFRLVSLRPSLLSPQVSSAGALILAAGSMPLAVESERIVVVGSRARALGHRRARSVRAH